MKLIFSKRLILLALLALVFMIAAAPGQSGDEWTIPPDLFAKDAINGIPLFVLIMVIVEFIKERGVAGNALYYSSLGLGVILGTAYQFAVSGVPATFTEGFSYLIYGLALGFTASKSYSLLANTTEKSFYKAVVNAKSAPIAGPADLDVLVE